MSVPAAAATGWGERGWEGEVRERGAGSGAGGLILTLFCVATVNGEAKRGYFFEIVSPMVYYLKSFQVWVNFV
jgi:hypothetical protein